MDDTYSKVYEGLIRRIKRYNPSADEKLLRKAFEFSQEAHQAQVRKSGVPYFEHPLEVAKILTSLRMDYETVAGGVLHDVAEDTEFGIERVEKEFGTNIAVLVDGVTKISELKIQGFEAQQAENFRKMLLSMVKDIRVILIKFADRLHNMRTLEYLPEKKRQRIALETREVYAPLAHRLGLAKIKWELEDLSLKYLEPDVYFDLYTKIRETRQSRESTISEVTRPIRKALVEAKIHARFEGRPKHFYSIFTKITKRGVPFEEIYDLLAIRIIVDKIEECYHALGIVHALFTPIHERFKDYIATPKSNGYQSLHTTLIGPQGKKVEIQIRTEQMHRTAEDGIAAHWRYKEGRLREDDLDKHLSWLRQVLDYEEGEPDSSFLDHLKINLFQDEVFVFTPKGDLFRLPVHSTPVDFAFAIHTDIGLHCLAAKVNGKIVPLSHELKSGDTVEILTSTNQRPNEDWLKFVVSSRARNRIKKVIKDSQFESSISLGEEMLSRALARFGKKIKDMRFEAILEGLKLKDQTALYAGIGRGDIKLDQLIRKLLPEEKASESGDQFILKKFIERARKSTRGIRVAGMDNIMINFGGCCNPVPGEPITGIVTKGRGIVIHTNTCKNLIRLMQDTDRIVDVTWDVEKGSRFLSGIYVLGERRNKFLSEISEYIALEDGNITSVNMNSENSLVNCVITLEVYDVGHLQRIMNKIKKLPGIISVDRLNK
ncbi:bifunctional (p)ppGpp synthetase/guanosine-3',5'-bis(diphosphate) 3'-pyrophosphohydrolase [candidate division KSB1 bacterium]|nr:bifunctional (p)ppGpp synthetase/guanosine-3',5'-bis(diphosphate) 3'-pyrophosphohydrolase [candidate division KSB1 bacterium]